MKKVIIAGGGTGGHIYPGLAIAKALEESDSNIKVEFVGAKGGLEETLVAREHYPLHLVEVGKLHASVGLWTRFKTLLGLPSALIRSWKILSVVNPIAVLGVGGYASGPILLVAALRGYSTFIWEPNVFPGMTNRILSRFVGTCIVVFSQAEKYLHAGKVVRMGLPVRPEIEALALEAPRDPTSESQLRILIFGGSQGARGINKAVMAAVNIGGDWLNRVHIVHQTGRLDFPEVAKSYATLDLPQLEVHEFLYDMAKRLSWADLVICRAGASTVAEIAAAKKSAILIPLPTAADNHQQKNAETLQQANAGKMILQKDFDGQRLVDEIRFCLEHRQDLVEWGRRVKQFHFPEAAQHIAEEIVKGTT